MTSPELYGLCAATLVGLGLYGVILHREWLRRLVSLNILSAGIFLLYGAVARRGGNGAIAVDPVPQALIITGIVVAFAATALAVALLLRWAELERNTSQSPPRSQVDGSSSSTAGNEPRHPDDIS